MKNQATISFKRTNNATLAVQRELFQIGLWFEDSKLYNANIFCCHLLRINSLGLLFHDTSKWHKYVGYQPGNIYIPSIVLSNILWLSAKSVRDIIRHEYAHAFAHYYPELIIDFKEFKQIFGGHYYSKLPSNMEEEAYLSEYARTIPKEDFAEMFKILVQKMGETIKIVNKNFIKKWMFINKNNKTNLGA